MPLSSLQKQLQFPCGKKLKLTLNDNRSTMLSVKWDPECTRVSLHRAFLNAPQNVMQALASYLQENDKAIHPSVKAFIEENVQVLDYSDQIIASNLFHQGNVYNVMEMYESLNSEYFDGGLNLKITWFGNHKISNKNTITFGLYFDPLRLIKINRFLDASIFPDYVVSYIIYHEMLHNSCPPFVDENGIKRIHNTHFKKCEAEFKHYRRAKNWIRDHRAFIFSSA
jgi:hypothetical protein